MSSAFSFSFWFVILKLQLSPLFLIILHFLNYLAFSRLENVDHKIALSIGEISHPTRYPSPFKINIYGAKSEPKMNVIKSTLGGPLGRQGLESLMRGGEDRIRNLKKSE